MDKKILEEFKKREAKMHLYQKCFFINIGSSFTGNPNELYTVNGQSIRSSFLTYYAKIYLESFATTEERKQYKEFRTSFTSHSHMISYSSPYQKSFYEFINDCLYDTISVENARKYYKESTNTTEKKLFEKAFSYYVNHLTSSTHTIPYEDILKIAFDVFLKY